MLDYMGRPSAEPSSPFDPQTGLVFACDLENQARWQALELEGKTLELAAKPGVAGQGA